MPVKKLPRITPYVVRLPCESHGMSRKLARPKRFELLTPRFVVWGLYLIIPRVRYSPDAIFLIWFVLNDPTDAGTA